MDLGLVREVEADGSHSILLQKDIFGRLTYEGVTVITKEGQEYLQQEGFWVEDALAVVISPDPRFKPQRVWRARTESEAFEIANDILNGS